MKLSNYRKELIKMKTIQLAKIQIGAHLFRVKTTGSYNTFIIYHEYRDMHYKKHVHIVDKTCGCMQECLATILDYYRNMTLNTLNVESY